MQYKTCRDGSNRTSDYMFTVTSKDDQNILRLKRDVRIHNKHIRDFTRKMKEKYGVDRALKYLEYSTLRRVRLMARGPRAVHAVADGYFARSYDQTLPHKYAESFDVYAGDDSTAMYHFYNEIKDGITQAQQAAISKMLAERARFQCMQAQELEKKYGIKSYGTREGTKYVSTR